MGPETARNRKFEPLKTNEAINSAWLNFTASNSAGLVLMHSFSSKDGITLSRQRHTRHHTSLTSKFRPGFLYFSFFLVRLFSLSLHPNDWQSLWRMVSMVFLIGEDGFLTSFRLLVFMRERTVGIGYLRP